jgi:hypothetical protein
MRQQIGYSIARPRLIAPDLRGPSVGTAVTYNFHAADPLLALRYSAALRGVRIVDV